MKHWPSFEPSGEAGAGALFAPWPSVAAEEDEDETASAAPVEAEPPGAPSETAPPVDPAEAASPVGRARRGRLSPLVLLASLALHGAAIALALHFLTQAGMEAETEAVSVEIVVDASPATPSDPSLAGQAAIRSEVTTLPPAEADTEVLEQADADPTSAAEASRIRLDPVEPTRLASEEPLNAEPPSAAVPARQKPVIPVPATADSPPVATAVDTPPAAVRAVPARRMPVSSDAIPVLSAAAAEVTVPPPPFTLPAAAPELAEAVSPAEPVKLPDEAPRPRPAPVPDERKPARAAPSKAADAARQPAANAGRPAPRDAVPPKRRPNRSTPAGVGNAAGRGSVASRGGASAGEKAAYAARLHSHVQRFERYPPEAQRRGVAGAVGILITIDRGGRLLSARLAGSSGSAILDRAAKDTATRASPYPPPPDGIGGRTLTFAATIRFRR